jgi:hypothetical protein
LVPSFVGGDDGVEVGFPDERLGIDRELEGAELMGAQEVARQIRYTS